MKPINQNILVKPFPASDKTEGGIFVPDSVKQPSNKVLIVAVGDGSEKKPMKLKPGQTGFRVKDWGEPIEIDGELHFIMTQQSILAVQ